MCFSNLKKSKSGHPIQKINFLSHKLLIEFMRMQIPITLCLKAKGIHTASPGNSYKDYMNSYYINLSLDDF